MAATTLKMSGAPFPKASKVTPYENVCIKENSDKTVQIKKTTTKPKYIVMKTWLLYTHWTRNWFTFSLFMQSTNELDMRIHFVGSLFLEIQRLLK